MYLPLNSATSDMFKRFVAGVRYSIAEQRTVFNSLR